MNETNTNTFVKVNYDLLASNKLNSTQKVFISYILGWQKNGMTCIETNNNLASKFGMKYAGIRSMISELNKCDFFSSVKKDFDSNNNTSGHEITVDEKKLMEFLNFEKPKKETFSNQSETLPSEDTNSTEEESTSIEPKEHKSIIQYRDEDIVSLQEIMTDLEFNQNDINAFKNHFEKDNVTFEEFCHYFSMLNMEQCGHVAKQYYKGVVITDDQFEKYQQMKYIEEQI